MVKPDLKTRLLVAKLQDKAFKSKIRRKDKAFKDQIKIVKGQD